MAAMRVPLLLTVALLLAASTARASDHFLGWSADNSFYLRGKTSSNGTQRSLLCLTDERRGSTTWPADILRPSASCVTLCSDDEKNCDEPTRAKALVAVPPAQKFGPKHETITVLSKNGQAQLLVTAGSRELAAATILLDRPTSSAIVLSAHWRSDDGGVAIVLGTKTTKTRYLALLAWKPPASPTRATTKPLRSVVTSRLHCGA